MAASRGPGVVSDQSQIFQSQSDQAQSDQAQSDQARNDQAWDAVIVAGGAGRRLGGVSKADLVVGGVTLLDRTLEAIGGARRTVVVGGPQRDGVEWTVENPPGGGPAAAVAAGIAALALPGAPWTVVLGVDTPLAAVAVPALLAARAGDGSWMVDQAGREQPLVAIYRTRALADRVAALTAAGGPEALSVAGGSEALAGLSLRRLVEGLAMTAVPDPSETSHDLDTWEDAQYWKEHLG